MNEKRPFGLFNVLQNAGTIEATQETLKILQESQDKLEQILATA